MCVFVACVVCVCVCVQFVDCVKGQFGSFLCAGSSLCHVQCLHNVI